MKLILRGRTVYRNQNRFPGLLNKQNPVFRMPVSGIDYFSRGVHEPELATENGFREILKST